MKKILFLVIIIIIIGSGLAYFKYKQKDSSEAKFEFTEIIRGDLENLVSCTGTLEAVGAVEVGTELSGTVSKVFVDFNDNVKKNQVLAILDTTQLAINLHIVKADLIRAEAQYELSQKQYENNLKLFNKQYFSELELQTSETAMKTSLASLLTAQANVEKAEININKYSIVRSPINGKIIDRTIEEGQTVVASLSAPTLFYIAEDLKNMEIYAFVDESDIGMIKTGMLAVFTVESYPDEIFEGVVKQIRLQPETISNVVNYTVIVEADNNKGLMLPGMTATVDFIVEERNDVLLVSSAALKFKPDQELLAECVNWTKGQMDSRQGNNVIENTKSKDGNRKVEMPTDIARLWYFNENNELQVTKVKIGATDGFKVEIVEGEDVFEGMQVITKQNNADNSSTNSSSSLSMRGMRF